MCPDREILSAWLDGEIDAPWDRALEEHVGSCPDCRARLERLEAVRRSLLEAPVPDWRPAMERVRSSLVSRGFASEKAAPVWRRRVSLPMPLAVAAALLVMVLAGALAVSVIRSSFGVVRITRQGSGGTEIRIAASVSDLESLLRSVDEDAGSLEGVITLPKDVQLLPVGQPLMGKEAEFSRRKSW
jgi:anti-sigma factor RsiW